MGILDDAIRDHLDLKRRRGTDEPEIKRLEDEAFGPAGRPDASGTLGATASAVATPPVESPSAPDPSEGLELESPLDVPAAEPHAAEETPPPDGPAPETPPAPQPEASPDEGAGDGETPEAEAEIVFHDFAAEEGLVDTGKPAAELEEAAAEAEAPAPGSEDTQVHDMAKELGLGDREEGPATAEQESAPDPGGEVEPTLGELDMDELDLELEDEELELTGEVGDTGVNGSGEPAGSVEVVEESEEAATVEPSADEPEDGEDVLEETPDFLRDAPESDRLWFEQGKPKDFDFDEDE